MFNVTFCTFWPLCGYVTHSHTTCMSHCSYDISAYTRQAYFCKSEINAVTTSTDTPNYDDVGEVKTCGMNSEPSQRNAAILCNRLLIILRINTEWSNTYYVDTTDMNNHRLVLNYLLSFDITLRPWYSFFATGSPISSQCLVSCPTEWQITKQIPWHILWGFVKFECPSSGLLAVAHHAQPILYYIFNKWS